MHLCVFKVATNKLWPVPENKCMFCSPKCPCKPIKSFDFIVPCDSVRFSLSLSLFTRPEYIELTFDQLKSFRY